MSQSLDIKDLELNALLEITQAINNNLSEEDLFRIYRFTLLADLKVRQLALFVKDADWVCKVHFGTSTDWSQQALPAPYTQLNEITLLQESSKPFDVFEQAIPVTHKDRLLAVVFVGGVDEEVISDSTFLRALTNIIIVAIENKKLARKQLEQEAYRKELEIAKKVQNFLFPKELPKTHRLKVEAVYLPHQDVGGDYYDYLTIDNDSFLVCVADVSGKGVPAALLMSNFQASLRTLVRKTNDPREIVEELNHTITSSGNGENFITFFLGIYDFRHKSFEYVNCGHNPLYLVTKDGIEELNDGTTILGMFDPLPFLTTKKVENLDEFFFFGYTDGLTETFNAREEQFGEERLLEFFKGGMPKDIDKLHRQIFEQLDGFRAETPYRDDITMLSCLVKN
ncbi:PP2C family protein-serine/threonine phosphatase [Marinoscillum furvescens]|uniref:Sigma-B regulation protein RsbU (Phosphoserine phosphatase) n=1 Tax=Marinoscillum furvescens DSM 4134 TaxID=1122208 RepID=A0A3D9LGF5_MARFU|nr:PP2C family protein-serine/threonine phosphatase [Marinoscillum furvescens]REE05728.1 sigma-B regulation protein RsbU (phosphoserine phosphatase) [Marinoscillum furvescens DSM 4134]